MAQKSTWQAAVTWILGIGAFFAIGAVGLCVQMQ